MRSEDLPSPPSRHVTLPPEAPLPVLLLRASVWLYDALRDLQERRDFPTVTQAQAMLLGHVVGGERRAVRIARKLGVTRQAISTTIAELVERGFLVVEKDPQDARAQLIDIAPDHAATLPQLIGMLREIEQHLGTIVGPDRLAVFRTVLSADWGPPRLPEPAAGSPPR